MQVTITRTKAGRTHHAVSVAAQLGSDGAGRQTVTGRGNVLEWTEDPAKAGTFPEEVAKRVAEHHNGKLNAGDLVFRDEKGKVLAETEGAEPAAPAPKPATERASAAEAESKAMFELRAERDEFRKQAKELGEEVALLREESERLAAESKQQKTYADTAAQVDEGRRKEIAELNKRIKELEEAQPKKADNKK